MNIRKDDGAAIRARLLLTSALAGLALMPNAALAQAGAPTVMFSTGTRADGGVLRAGEALVGTVDIRGGTTQVRTADGDIVSMVGDSRFTADGDNVSLEQGRFTVIAGSDGIANVRVNGDMVVAVNGTNASASFSVDPLGLLTGRGLGGNVSVTADGVTRSFDIGEAFRAALGQLPTQIITAGAQPVSAGVTNPVPGIDVGQNPSLVNYPAGSAETLLSTLINTRGDSDAFGIPSASLALLNANLASVRFGEPLGSFDAARSVAEARALLPALQSTGATAAGYAFLESILAYIAEINAFTAANAGDAAAINQFVAVRSAGLPTDVAAGVGILSTYIGGLQTATRGTSGGYTQAQLLMLAGYVRANGIPAATTAADRARLEALYAFMDAGGTFGRTPGVVLPNAGSTVSAGVSSALTSGDYVGGLDTVELGADVAARFTPVAVTFGASGAPTSFGSRFSQGALVPVEGASGADWIIGRYAQTTRSTDGTYFAIAKPYTLALPTTGTARYTLLAATTPSYRDGRVVTASSMTASLGIGFGSVASVYGFEGTISTTDLGRVNEFAFTTPGGAAAPSIRTVFGSGPVVIGDSIIVTSNSNVCGTGSSGCLFQPNLVLGGTSGQIVAGTYLISQTGSFPILGGAFVLQGELPAVTPPVVTPPVITPPAGQIAMTPGVSSSLQTGSYLSAGVFQTSGNSAFSQVYGSRTVRFETTGVPIDLQPTQARGSKQLVASASGDEWLLARFGYGRPASPTTGALIGTNNFNIWDTAFMRPITTALPTNGRAEYTVLSHTTPIAVSGQTIASSTFDGRIALSLDAARPAFGMDATLNIVRTGETDAEVYRFGSADQFASLFGAITFDASGIAINNAGVEVRGPGCTALCTASLALRVGGSAGQLLGGGYRVLNNTSPGLTELFFGGVMFQQSSYTPGTVVSPTLTPVTPTPNLTNQLVRSYSPVFAGSLDSAAIFVTSDHRLESITSGTRNNLRGTNTDVDNSGVAGIIGWTRWTGGTTAGSHVVVAPQNGGSSIIWGTQATNVPTTGTATYSMIGATSPTTEGATTAPGNVTAAQLAVSFATLKVGLEATVNFGGSAYNLTSAGGLAAPSVNLSNTNWTFASSVPLVGGGCVSGGSCTSRISGFLAGPTGNHAGLAYVFASAPSGGVVVNGTIAFASGD